MINIKDLDLTCFRILIDLASQRNTKLNKTRNTFFNKRMLNQVKHCITKIDELKNLKVQPKDETKLADVRNKLGHVANLMDLITILYTATEEKFIIYAENRIDIRIDNSKSSLNYIERYCLGRKPIKVQDVKNQFKEIRKTYPNAYKPWVEMFDNQLKHNYMNHEFFEILRLSKFSITEINEMFELFIGKQIKIFGRQKGGITARLKFLELKPFWEYTNRIIK